MKRVLLVGAGSIAGLLVLGGLLVALRQIGAAALAERAWRSTTVEPITSVGTTTRLEIVPLYEEAAGLEGVQSGHGVAYLVRTDEATILLDVGNNPQQTDPSPLLSNMQRLGVDPAELDALVFSHAHPDHLGGLNWWRAGTFSLGNEQAALGDLAIYVPEPLSYPAATPVVSAEPTVVAPGVATSGAILFPEVFPLSLFAGVRAEQALAVNVEGRGIVLLTSCGHPGLKRLVERGEALFEAPVVGIVGGLHYEGLGAERVQSHITTLRSLRPHLVALSPHDSGPAEIGAFREAFPGVYQEVAVGRPIVLEGGTHAEANAER